MQKVRAKVIVKGRVQGVYYRSHTEDMANELGLKGYVRNLPDGSVEAVFEGLPKDVEAMTEWCKKGSPGAKVESIDIKHEDPRHDFDGFRIRYDNK